MSGAPAERPGAVLHVVERYLELSAGFVHGQLSRSRRPASVFSRLPPEHLDAYPVAPRVSTLPPALDRLPQPLRTKVGNRLVIRAAAHAGAVLVHAHFGYALPEGAVLARGMPLVVSLHGHDLTAWPSEAPWVYPATAHLVSAAIVPSRFLATYAVANGIPEERVHVIPSGVDTALFTPAPPPGGAPTACFVGRFVEKKGLDTLLAAWPAVRAAVPDARLVVLGRGPLEADVERAARAGIGVERLLPDPSRRHQQVAELLAASTCAATPSRTAASGDSESLLLVNLEAQASGRAVVTTRHGGIPEFVEEGRSALVVPEADPAALAGALVAVLSDPALATRLGAAGPHVAARFDATAMAGRVDDLYDEVLAARRAPAGA